MEAGTRRGKRDAGNRSLMEGVPWTLVVKVAMSGYKRNVPKGKENSGGIRRNTGICERSNGPELGGSGRSKLRTERDQHSAKALVLM